MIETLVGQILKGHTDALEQLSLAFKQSCDIQEALLARIVKLEGRQGARPDPVRGIPRTVDPACDQCGHCGKDIVFSPTYLDYTDDLGGRHYFCSEECKDAWKDSLSPHDRLMLTGETGA